MTLVVFQILDIRSSVLSGHQHELKMKEHIALETAP